MRARRATEDRPVPKSGSHRLYVLLLTLVILPFLVNGYVNAHIHDRPALYWSHEILIWVVLPIAAALIAHRLCGVTWADVGLTRRLLGRRRSGELIAMCLVFCALDWLVYSSALVVARAHLPAGGTFGYGSVIPDAGVGRLLVLSYFALTAGFVEEIVYRGGFMLAVRPTRFPRLTFLALSPVVFALIHWEGGWANVAATYVFGLAAAGAYLWLRNLWPLIAGHVFTDYAWLG